MIDWNRVSELREEFGDKEFEEVIDLFVDEIDTEITVLEPLQDAGALESRLHFLKGSALNLGFSAFAQICQRAEFAAARGAIDDIDIGAVLSCYYASKSELHDFLRRTVPN